VFVYLIHVGFIWIGSVLTIPPQESYRVDEKSRHCIIFQAFLEEFLSSLFPKVG